MTKAVCPGRLLFFFPKNERQLTPDILTELVRFKMPYGKYKDTLIADLPEFYLVWYAGKGFPAGKLGMLLGTMYEIKLNGLEYLLKPLR